ncbi:unnamed protein product [Orchesella dallaii]|uniref:StAR-related lipid transfer protein 3 n=1 Tax=Orchesella dallaii TaxID=48710 RepID=A0ABP1S2D5_9HEXA
MEAYRWFEYPSEDVFLGIADGRSLSPVRRFFCLLVTFDFFFTILLWILSIILIKGATTIPDALEIEVLQYTFRSRMFDVVMAAAVRLTVILLFYGLLGGQHYIPVALTTTGTCAFLITKVFMFSWDQSSNAIYPVMLILSSFILAWSEVWFFDFRVVPLERQARFFNSRQQARGGNSIVNPESQGVMPWLGRNVAHIAQTPLHRSYPESIVDFYSPLESPAHSDAEQESSETESMEKKNLIGKTCNSTPSSAEAVWLQQSPVIAQHLLARVRSDHWVLDKTTDNGDNVFSQKSPKKIFMISGTLYAHISKVVTELFDKFESMPDWNPAVSFCQIIQKLNPVTDVSYQVSKGAAGVSPRDFVTLRHYKVFEDGYHVIAIESVKHPNSPKKPKVIRGLQGTSGWVFKPQVAEPDRTDFQWVLDIDLLLNSFIPKKIIETGIIAASLDTVNFLRTKLACTVDHLDIVRDHSDLHMNSLPGGMPRRNNVDIPSSSHSLK